MTQPLRDQLIDSMRAWEQKKGNMPMFQIPTVILPRTGAIVLAHWYKTLFPPRGAGAWKIHGEMQAQMTCVRIFFNSVLYHTDTGGPDIHFYCGCRYHGEPMGFDPCPYHAPECDPVWREDGEGGIICQHGHASDVHCCNCHGGFVVDGMAHHRSCALSSEGKEQQ